MLWRGPLLIFWGPTGILHIPLLWSPQNPAKSLHTNSHRNILVQAYDALQLALDVSLHAGRHLVSKVLQSDPLVSALDTMVHTGWSISSAFRAYMNANAVAPLLKAARCAVDGDYRLSQLEVPVSPSAGTVGVSTAGQHAGEAGC